MAKFQHAREGMTLGEHLTEIRRRFLVVALSLGVLGVLSFIFYPATQGRGPAVGREDR